MAFTRDGTGTAFAIARDAAVVAPARTENASSLSGRFAPEDRTAVSPPKAWTGVIAHKSATTFRHRTLKRRVPFLVKCRILDPENRTLDYTIV
jgi:hypothetical protein